MAESWKLCLNIFRAFKCIVSENGSYPTKRKKNTRGFWGDALYENLLYLVFIILSLQANFCVHDVNPCRWCVPNWICFLCVNMTSVDLNWSTIVVTIEYIFRTYSVLEKTKTFTLIQSQSQRKPLTIRRNESKNQWWRPTNSFVLVTVIDVGNIFYSSLILFYFQLSYLSSNIGNIYFCCNLWLLRGHIFANPWALEFFSTWKSYSDKSFSGISTNWFVVIKSINVNRRRITLAQKKNVHSILTPLNTFNQMKKFGYFSAAILQMQFCHIQLEFIWLITQKRNAINISCLIETKNMLRTEAANRHIQHLLWIKMSGFFISRWKWYVRCSHVRSGSWLPNGLPPQKKQLLSSDTITTAKCACIA